MKKLKTLKEIRKDWDKQKYTFDGQNCAREGMLRQEAIKCLKQETYRGGVPSTEFGKGFIEGYSEGQKDFIKWFFNITDDEHSNGGKIKWTKTFIKTEN